MAITINGSTGISGVPAGGYNLVDGDMPSGAVLQVVQGTYSTRVTSSTNTLVDTGLSASITPSSTSNKVLCIVTQAGCIKTGNTDIHLKLYRDATGIHNPSRWEFYTASTLEQRGLISFSYLDSPSSTSALTYKTKFASGENVATAAVQWDGGDTVSSIILMEIAA